MSGAHDKTYPDTCTCDNCKQPIDLHPHLKFVLKAGESCPVYCDACKHTTLIEKGVVTKCHAGNSNLLYVGGTWYDRPTEHVPVEPQF